MATDKANWSGSVSLESRHCVRPHSVEQVVDAVRSTHRRGGRLRAVGSAHSSSGVLGCEDTLMRLAEFKGVLSVQADTGLARVRPGTPLAELGRALYAHDLALPNYGDIALQTLGGAVSTGTHGSGLRQQNLSQMLQEVELVDGSGQLRRLQAPAELAAAQVSLGCLGVMTELTIRCVPTFDVERREYACRMPALAEALPELVRGNYSLDFYWYPRRDDVKVRLVNPVGGGTAAPAGARQVESASGHGHLLIPTHSGLPHAFEESEFAVPLEQGLDCFLDVRQRILQRWRPSVGWRVLYRTVAADDAWLSPAQGRAIATISLHQNASLPWREFFDDLASVFAAYRARPHWAKKHSLQPAALRALYPHWDDFLDMRQRLDPDGTFLSEPMRRLFGLEPAGRDGVRA